MIIFSRGDAHSIALIKGQLGHFEKASGLTANKTKSSIYFGGLDPLKEQELVQVAEIPKGILPFRYLGVPLTSKKLHIKHHEPLVEKILSRITSWEARLLSYAGRKALISSIIISIHSYWSQIFLFPEGVIEEIERICRGFLWT